MKKPAIDHVAILVSDIDKALAAWSLKTQNKVDEFADIGTRELYVGDNGACQRLLLMQAIGPGPYEDALKKRGPGLHHIGINVPDFDAFLPTVEKSGWLLHPKSLRFYKAMKQVYLCRPDVPVLIELGEGDAGHCPKFIEAMSLKIPEQHRKLFDIFDTSSLDLSNSENKIFFDGHELCLDELKVLAGGPA